MNAILIKNANIMSMDDENRQFLGWIFLQDGKIAALGEGEAPVKPDAHVFDAENGVVTPGLIDVHAHLGLYEDGLGFEGADGNEDTDPVTPHLRAIDGVNPMERGFREAVEAGVTTVAVSPGSANPIGGEIALIKTAGRRIDDMLVKSPLAIKFALGENPKSCYHDKDETPVTRMATAALVREQLFKAREYLARKERAIAETEEDEPDFDMRLEALLPLLRGKIEAHFHAHRADDIFTALRLSKEFGLRPVIIHGTEAHLVADLLAAEQVPVVSGPFLTDRSKPELQQLTERAPGLLCRAGIETAITVDHPETPLRLLTMALAVAVKAGMDELDALRAVTRVPAHIAGVDDRMGQIKEGMDGDLVLWSDHPLDFRTQVKAVWINGVQEYRRNA